MGFIQPISYALQQSSSLTVSALPLLLPPTHLQNSAAAAKTSLTILRGGYTALYHAQAYKTSLYLSSFLCTSVFGMMLFVAIAYMPGIAALPAREYLLSFRAVDKIFQDGRPIIGVFWLGSIISNIATTVIGLWGGAVEKKWDKLMLVVSSILFLAGNVATFRINIPINNDIQALNIPNLGKEALSKERIKLEGPWNKANWLRVICFGASSLILLMQMLFVE